jgi:hypothetical protein
VHKRIISAVKRVDFVSDRMSYIIQGAAEIIPTFQRGITNKWYEVSPKMVRGITKNFLFPKCRYHKVFLR